ncbi:hypothetical protein KQI82_08915 [Oscillibacter sp. MSJ-2]|uniref:Uncharacterized protein n=1 Tax=Dysosmobacter acutus TaxID=2841504 RepID=A0ABS6FBJ0_9FIRM|nr:hypothetical protein [Dysosmobacter acutus]MBU5627026.1 hypothetical protein [Dysosmobacter acutus]
MILLLLDAAVIKLLDGIVQFALQRRAKRRVRSSRLILGTGAPAHQGG